MTKETVKDEVTPQFTKEALIMVSNSGLTSKSVERVWESISNGKTPEDAIKAEKELTQEIVANAKKEFEKEYVANATIINKGVERPKLKSMKERAQNG
jgi:hypothetical protein